MLRLFLSALLLFSLAACAPGVRHTDTAMRLCQGSDSPLCRFLNAPVQLEPETVTLPGRAYPFRPIAAPLSFRDADEQRWIAPPGTLTDGASIPPIFTDLIGAPTSREFANAAALHDALCGIGNEDLPGFHSETWEKTHRMFYQALRVGGTDEVRAKIMFAAVYLGGPRWEDLRPPYEAEGETSGRLSTQGAGPAPETRGLENWARAAGVPDVRLRAEMRRTRDWIAAQNPSIPAIEAHLTGRERSLVDAQTAQSFGADTTGPGTGSGMSGDDGAASPGESGEDTGGSDGVDTGGEFGEDGDYGYDFGGDISVPGTDVPGGAEGEDV